MEEELEEERAEQGNGEDDGGGGGGWWRSIAFGGRRGGSRHVGDIDGKLHSMPAVASTAEEVVWPWVCEVEDISPTLGDICDELLLTASLIVCLVHLKNSEVVLVEDEIFKSKWKRKLKELYQSQW